jgi:hypothetical protein
MRKNQNAGHKNACSEGTPLSQEELKAWWPFERLDPKRFPKQPKATEPDPLEDFEEALL